MEQFDPNGPSIPGTLFGLPYSVGAAKLVVIPVPWEATVSYGKGTSNAPEQILEASSQVDMLIPELTEVWKFPVAMEDADPELKSISDRAREKASRYVQALESGDPEIIKQSEGHRNFVNIQCSEMVDKVYARSKEHLQGGRIPAVLGGDHSSSEGIIKAMKEFHKSFGVLQIDAHHDLRRAYEGFDRSHASIMYNVLEAGYISGLVQVGIRDYCEEESRYQRDHRDLIHTVSQVAIDERIFGGGTWSEIVGEIVTKLPDRVYISFDIDGLDPAFCPNTGTPVPGGLSFGQTRSLIKEVAFSGRKIVGFDLCEVGVGRETTYDANVGARVLHLLSGFTAFANGFVSAKA